MRSNQPLRPSSSRKGGRVTARIRRLRENFPSISRLTAIITVRTDDLPSRLAARKGQFSPPSLLDGQLGILEEPDSDENSIHVDVSRPIEDVVADIMRELHRQLAADRWVVTARAERPSIQPGVQWTDSSISVEPNGAMETSRRTDSPLAIKDYALINDCRTAALVGRNGSIDWLCWPRFDSNACFAALLGTIEHGRWRICPADPKPRVNRAYRDGTMVLETVFEAAEGRVALIDFFGHANSSVIRLVKGQRGKVAMRLHLTLRFDYGATVPWVTQLEDESGLSAVAGPSRVALRSAVKLEGENLATVAEFDVAEGECVPFVLTHVPSHGCAGNGPRAKYDNNLNLDLSGSHCQELQLC